LIALPVADCQRVLCIRHGKCIRLGLGNRPGRLSINFIDSRQIIGNIIGCALAGLNGTGKCLDNPNRIRHINLTDIIHIKDRDLEGFKRIEGVFIQLNQAGIVTKTQHRNTHP